MQESIGNAKSDGVIKSVEDFKLNNETKRLVKQGIIWEVCRAIVAAPLKMNLCKEYFIITE